MQPFLWPTGACALCNRPLDRTGRWHRDTGTVSCRPVVESDDEWSEPDDWAEGPCATLGPEARLERTCARCGKRTAWTGYAWEHASSGTSGTLSCDR